MKKLYGVITAMTTPFTADNKVDVAALEAQTEYLIQKGVQCLYPCGTTGEMYLMSAEERELVAETVVKKAAGRVTVFIHVGVGMAAAAAAGCAHNVFLQNLFRNFKIQYAQFMPLRCREMVTPAFGAGFAVPVQGNFFAAVQAPGFPRGCFNRKARAL